MGNPNQNSALDPDVYFIFYDVAMIFPSKIMMIGFLPALKILKNL